MERRHTQRGDTQEVREWGHIQRWDTYGEEIHTEKGSRDKYKNGTHTKRTDT